MIPSLPQNPEETAQWDKILRSLEGGIILGVEIGCLYGDSAETILRADPRVHLISIDPFIKESPGTPAEHQGNREIVFARLGPCLDRFVLKEDYSWNVAPTFGNGTLDFLFIDGDHSYEAVARDFRDWTPKLRRLGMLFMHDASMDGPYRVLQNYLLYDPKWTVIYPGKSLFCAQKVSRETDDFTTA